MKNISFLNVLFFALAIFGISSCGSDDETINSGPTISFQKGAGIISRDTFVIPGVPFTVRLSVSKGKSPLKSLTITAGDLNYFLGDRIIHIDGNHFPQNPTLITSQYADSFIWDIRLIAHADKEEIPYHFTVTDENNETSTATLLINTAGEDGTPPSLFIHNLMPFSMVLAPEDQVFNFKISATKGSSKLAAMAVFVYDHEWNTYRLLGGSFLRYKSLPFTANPQPLDPADVDGFTNESFGITGTGFVDLEFSLIDEAGRTTSWGLSVIPAGNPTQEEYSGVLLYNASGSNLSGLDLDTGQSVSSDSIDADLIDMGNDNIPNGNWLQQLKPADGVVLREVEEGGWLVFSEVSTNNDIYAAFNQGVEKPHTDVLSVGAMFCLYKDNAWGNDYYYLLEIADIVVTPDNDLDYYEINVKRASF